MAEIIVSLLVQQLQNLLVERNKLYGGLRIQLQLLKNEFERMIVFLKVADLLQDKDPEVAAWVKQVQEIAHDTEDVLDEYDLLLPTHPGKVERFFSSIKNCRARSKLATEIESIKSRVHDVSEEHQRYCARYEIQVQAWRSSVSNYSDANGCRAAHLQDEANLVGIQKRKGELFSGILDGDSKIKVIAVVGMGGLGKTTLVKNVYEDKYVRSKFQTHAWVTVSAISNIMELLKAIVKQFCGEMKEPIPQEVHSMDTNELKEFVKDLFQGKNYIIVLDDVRDINPWQALKSALRNGSSHSRVLLTTRSKDVAFSSLIYFKGNIYKMQLLTPQESWVLFCNKVFKKDNCPSHLKDISSRILRKCGGLPLAIVAIGGTLASKDRGILDDWDLIYHSISVDLEGEGMLDKVNRILLLSFFNLPHNLKVCLLNLSIFPEDHEINCNHVIRLWIAEGFVEGREGLTMEEVGQSYLNKLVNASLLQAVQTTFEEKLKTVVVHDILREIIVLMSRRENLVMVVGEKAMRWPNKVQRLAIQGPLENIEDNNIIYKHLRSLVLFSPKDLPPQPLLSKMLCGGSKVLKVLDLRGAPLKIIPEEVFKLYLLEYLSLRGTDVKVIPKSVGKLRKLETLDLKDTFVTELPIEIQNLRRLRYLCVFYYEDWLINNIRRCSFRAPYKIGGLVSLQKLNCIDADEKDGVKIVKEIRKLTQLRSLGIEKLRKEDGKDFCSSLELLTNLQSLYVGSIAENEILDLQYNLSSTPNLRRLQLCGRLERMPQWVLSLQCLTKLCLAGSRLKEEPLRYYEDLPNLVGLLLVDAYEGEELHFKAGKFQGLKELVVLHLNGLRKIRVEKSSMPYLEEMLIAKTKLMQELPFGIEHLKNLQHLDFVDMSEKFIESLQNQRNRRTQAKIRVGNLKSGNYGWQWV